MKKTFKNNQPLFIAGIVLLIAALLYLSRDHLQSIFNRPPNKLNTASKNSMPLTTDNASNNTILQLGSRGSKVKELQVLLNDYHKKHPPTLIPYLVVDGNFGQKTQRMLKKHTGKTSISINQLLKDLA